MPMMDWTQLLKNEKQSQHFQSVMAFVDQQRNSGKTIYPPADKVFEAFRVTAFDKIKVVIIGQDPYHGPGQAHGLCFSVEKNCAIPPSLKNIYKELVSDLGIHPPQHGNLLSWAEQGVFLLNTVLTVEAGQANSHRGRGWETFTDNVITLLSEHSEHLVFLLWGAAAQKKVELIDEHKHTVLKTVHPSPLSAHRGFLGCKHFSKTNKALEDHHQTAINWAIDN